MKQVISFLLLCFLMSGCVTQHTKYHHFKSRPPHTLRIASYNLYWNNGTCSIHHPKSTTKLMRIINADILLLQETTPKLKKCIDTYLSNQYPYSEFRFHGKEGGLAILSKYPFTTVHYIPPQHGWFPAWLVNVHTPSGTIATLNLHLRPQVLKGDNIGMFAKALFTTPRIRECEIKQFYSYLKFGVPTVIAGDFNEEDHGRAVKFLNHRGFINTLALNPQYTWKHQYGPITFAKRFDRIFLSPHFSLRQTQVIHESSSDHFPVVSDVILR